MNLTIRGFLLVLLGMWIFACGSDGDTDVPTIKFEDLCIVTGIQFKDFNGQLIGNAGNPNISTDNAIFFPIPGDGIMSVQASSEISKVWLIPAEKSSGFQDVDFVSKNIIYDASEMNEKSDMSWELSGNSLTIDLGAFGTGYFRMICLTANGNLSYDNIYLDESKTANEIYEFLLGEW